MAYLIDGKKISQEIKDELKAEVAELARQGKTASLAVIQVGADPASSVYVRNKKNACAYIGIGSESYELPEETSEEELLALQYQMNPHFLLNSLNSIRWMAMMTNNKIVADTLVTLGKIITPMLRNPSLTWKIENEIEFLDNYVAMMQLRFGHDMEYSMNCSKEWYDLVFPRLILQPLIENCFVHGSSSEEIRTINVIIECNERIEVKVINSGVFFDEIQLKEIYMKMKTFSKASDHIGMANVYKRLNLLYGDQGSMRVESNRKLGFIVEVSFPKSTKM